MSARPHSHPITVEPEDIDFMGHVNNARYLNWVQDAVLAHWRKLAPAEDVANRAAVGSLSRIAGGIVRDETEVWVEAEEGMETDKIISEYLNSV